MLSEIKHQSRELFPLKKIADVVRLFRAELCGQEEPDLVLLSIVIGSIETALTAIKEHPPKDSKSKEDVSKSEISDGGGHLTETPGTAIGSEDAKDDFPVLDLKLVEILWSKFVSQVNTITLEDPGELDDHPLIELAMKKGLTASSVENVRRVANFIWNSLARTYYKDKAHLQTLFSYLIEGKLDPFGVSFSVVAACQVLGLSDVHLAVSEDHTWVQFGEEGEKTLEVTWHGKIADDRRGHTIDAGVRSRSWVYLCGKPVVGSRRTEVAALVSAINPSVSAHVDSLEVIKLHQALLWTLFDLGCLSNYPMALGNLADLEEVNPTPDQPSCEDMYEQAIKIAENQYDNLHVYPHTYLAGHFYRKKMYKEALHSWGNAGEVIGKYNYSRDDEEIYKEFLEIANELIPHIIKVESSGISAQTLMKDPGCFASILRFYDGLCMWEEEGSTPVLHIGWVKPLIAILAKYDGDVRKQSKIVVEKDLNSNDKESPNLILLRSQKMIDLRDLLVAEKLNTHAISLLLTAQSQVGKKQRGGESFLDGGGVVSRPKRLKRES